MMSGVLTDHVATATRLGHPSEVVSGATCQA